MWKIVLGFIVIAGLALFLLNRGADIDLSGEKHGALPAGNATADTTREGGDVSALPKTGASQTKIG